MKYNDSCIKRLVLLSMVNYPTKSSFFFHIHGLVEILLRGCHFSGLGLYFIAGHFPCCYCEDAITQAMPILEVKKFI